MLRGWNLLLVVLLPLAAAAQSDEQVVLGLSQDRVAITATFDGSEILIFGAVKRETPIPESELDVIVTVAGPSLASTVRRKERRFGIWINTEAVEIDSAPSFYAVATSGPFQEVLRDTEDLRYQVSIRRAIRSVGAPMSVADAQSFTDALIRIRTNNGSYQILEDAVEIDQQTLFRTRIAMPANLTEGDYRARILLTRNGTVISELQTMIDVRKVGLEQFLFELSRNNPLVYGLMSLFIAIAAGWLASSAFRLLRQG